MVIMIKVIRKIDIKFLFKSHCNCNSISMLLWYNSIDVKEQKQWNCEGEGCLYKGVIVCGAAVSRVKRVMEM